MKTNGEDISEGEARQECKNTSIANLNREVCAVFSGCHQPHCRTPSKSSTKDLGCSLLLSCVNFA